MITFENDMEPILVAFIYGKINYEQTVDILTNRLIKKLEQCVNEYGDLNEMAD